MNKKKIDRSAIVKSAIKMVEDKALVRSYLKGNTPIEKLTERGIKFATPL